MACEGEEEDKLALVFFFSLLKGNFFFLPNKSSKDCPSSAILNSALQSFFNETEPLFEPRLIRYYPTFLGNFLKLLASIVMM
ncbi:hypothetical protein IM40_00620 [Candidatus Paracaedimonas acanthamoebae]|nr:hypothetical protein IM40_00620 [Candidatus Paracaedimonas acanthamoebae]